MYAALCADYLLRICTKCLVTIYTKCRKIVLQVAPSLPLSIVPASETKKEAKSRLKALKVNISGGWATEKELWAWYMFDMANSPFYQVLSGIIYPLMLLYLGNFYACPYADYVANFNYPGGNFTETPIMTTCTTTIFQRATMSGERGQTLGRI